MSDLYIDLSAQIMPALAEHAAHIVTAGALILRDEIVTGMDPGPARTGRWYPIPGTRARGGRGKGKKRQKRPMYRASAPGEPPAIREGIYRDSWQTMPAVRNGNTVECAAYTDLKTEGGDLLGEILEYGTHDLVNYRVAIEPRPHIRPAIERAAQRIQRELLGVSA